MRSVVLMAERLAAMLGTNIQTLQVGQLTRMHMAYMQTLQIVKMYSHHTHNNFPHLPGCNNLTNENGRLSTVSFE